MRGKTQAFDQQRLKLLNRGNELYDLGDFEAVGAIRPYRHRW